MIVIESERTIMVDVDKTLVMHDTSEFGDKPAHSVKVVDPSTGEELTLYKNEPMIKCLQEELYRGAFVFIWSMGGYEWAKNVLTAIGFDDSIKNMIVMSKPFACFDDAPVESWLKYRLNIRPNEYYKGV